MSPLERCALRWSVALLACVAGCGGKVVFVADDGDGTQGGAPSFGGSPSFGGAPPEPLGGFGDGGSIGVGVPVTECQLACTTVFQCGFQTDSTGTTLCPGFSTTDPTAFVDGCATTCESQMALLALIDPNDCETTIETLQAVSIEFADTCAFGLP